MKWLHFILSHSIFVAVCAAALCWQTALLLHLADDLYLYGFVFFSTLCSYNFYWLTSQFYSRPAGQSAIDLLTKKPVQLFIFLLAATGMVWCFLGSGLSIGIVVPAVILTLLYAVPLLPYRFLRFTRRLGVLKTILLAFTWTYVTACVPVLHHHGELTDTSLFIISRRFLFMLMLCIIFDNRDVAVDKIRGMRSLATDLSPRTLQLFIIILFFLLFGTNFAYVWVGISIPHAIALQVSTIALLITYFYSTRKQGYFFYYFFVDGVMLFSALATFVAGK